MNASKWTAKILISTLVFIGGAMWLLLGQKPLQAKRTNQSERVVNTIYNGNPSNYRTLLDSLQAGDTLMLVAGTYTEGLPIYDMNGTAVNPIIITGPTNGARAVFTARTCCNTIEIQNSSYIEIYNLELDGQNLSGVDAVKAGGDENINWAHHITLENLYIHSHDNGQQTVGISTKIPSWDWVIRHNIIDSAGTGLYLGNSNGNAPFIRGLIEGNLIVDTVGYNMQIKHQNPRPSLAGMPTGDNVTIIRHNVFSKANNASTGGNARPNLLVGHWPLSGTGMNDTYEIYGNFFYDNPTGEPLFQGEGNIGLYDNLFVNPNGDAVWIQPHNDVPKEVRVFNNTAVTPNRAIYITGGDAASEQKVIGNAIFAATPISAANQSNNITDSYANANNYLTNPFAALGSLDLFPLTGTLTESALDNSSFNTFTDWDRDFNGYQHDGSFRGAYAIAGSNPGWLPQLERKPLDPVGDIQISGTISEGGNPLSNVTFSGSGTNCTSSDSGGNYSCFVADGWNGTITPARFGYLFTPSSRSYTNLMADVNGEGYTAVNTLTNHIYLPLVLK